MIKTSLKANFIRSIVGLSNNAIGTGRAYVALASGNVEEDASGNIKFYEPSTASGYKRYLLGNINGESRVTVSGTTARNTETLYFDEAIQSWGDPITYFVICTSGTRGNQDGIAYGRIVDEDGNPTSISVLKNQLPIIKANMLSISLSELEQPMYDVDFVVGDGHPEITKRINLYNVPTVVEETTTEIVEGLYYDAAFTDKAVPGSPLTKDTTLYVKWATKLAD